MNNLHAENTQRLIDAVLTYPGDTDPALRHMVEEQVAAFSSGSAAKAGELPPELLSYIKKITLYAYKILDEDVAALRALGYSEDAIFELTLSAALGAGKVRLERGYAALKGAE